MLTTRVDFDISKPLYNKITAKQGDIASRFLEFHLHANGVPFSLENKNVRFHMLKPDGTEIFNDVPKGSDVGVCILELTSQCLIEPGIGKAELVIYMGGKKLSTIPFKIEIVESVNSEAAQLSSNEFSALDEALSKIDILDNISDRVDALEPQVAALEPQVAALEPQVASWIDYKNNGGEISGNLITIQLATKSPSNNYRWAEETHNTGYKIISSNTNPSTGDWREEFIMAYDGFAPKNDKVLGTSENPWNDIFIKGVSKSQNGYTKLPNGLIMQWLYVGGSLSQGKGVVEGNLPMTFPNSYLSIFANVTYVDDSSTYNNLFNCNAKFVNNGYFNVNIKNLESNSGSFAHCYVLAIGY